MRKYALFLSVATLLVLTGRVDGGDQTVSPPTLDLPPRYERPRPTCSNPVMVERAKYRARQRMLRQEARAWRGISSGRPNVMSGSHAVDVNGFQMGSAGTLTWQPRW